jgi:polysaccharide export outer membrane protein
MKRLHRFFLAMIGLVTASAGHAQSAPDPSAGLNPGDQIRIVVWRKPELSGDFAIAANGTIAHPLYREVQVTGLSMSAMEERLRAFLSRYETSPQFVVQPLLKVIVGGEVRTPNIFSVPPETTIAQAIALAGGPTDRGELRKVHVIRERQDILMDISRPESEVSSLTIRSGDQILVSRKGRSPLEWIGPVASSIAAAAALIGLVVR